MSYLPKRLTFPPDTVDYFPDEVDAIPEKVAELIWLSQILALILCTITTKPTEDAVYDKYKYHASGGGYL